jgi:hypothetical protein
MDREELELAKLVAETEKLRREAENLKRAKWGSVGDTIKVFGAVAATVIAGAAGVTTYRITQLETKLAQKERHEAEAELTRVSRELASLTLSKTQTEAELAAVRSRVTSAQADLSKITSQAIPADVAHTISQARGTLRAAAEHPRMPFVFVSPFSESQTDSALKVAELLKVHGFETSVTSPRPERSHAYSTEVRYFRKPDDKALAVSILNALHEAGLQGGHVVYVDDPTVPQDRWFSIRFSQDAALR